MSKETEKRQKQAYKIWNEYQQGIMYQNEIGLRKDIPIWVDFFEGRQWAKSKKENRDLPRPVFNFVKLIVDNKHGNILNSPVHLNYIADNDYENSDRFTKFVEYDTKEMRLTEADDRVIRDSLVKGTGIYHFYFNENAIGKLGNYEGAVRCEVIDPLNFFVSDPTEQDIQKQEWIMFATRVSVIKAREMYEFTDKDEKARIVKDTLETPYESNHYEQEQPEDDGMTTVLTKYFRIDGEVYFQKSTKDVLLCNPKPCNPIKAYGNLKQAKKEKEREELGLDKDIIAIDKGVPTLPDSSVEEQYEAPEDIYYKAVFYPVDVLTLIERDGSIYGISEVESLREAQKCVNFQYALNTLAIQTLGSPKIVVKNGALKGQRITNKFGEVITDFSPTGTQGIYTVQTNPVTVSALTLPQNIIDLERVVSGANEVITGEMVSKDLSGTAIAQLQAQSQKPIAQLQKRFWRSKERIGKILEQFYKLFYEEREFSRELNEREKTLYRQNGLADKIPTEEKDTFNGYEYRKTNFNVVVEAGAGTQYSEIQTMSMLQTLMQSQLIDFPTYIELMPEKALPNKPKIKEYIALREQSEIVQLRQQVQQLTEQLEQLSAYAKDQENAVKEISGQLDKNMQITKDMQNEYTQKITKQNKFIYDNFIAKKQDGKNFKKGNDKEEK